MDGVYVDVFGGWAVVMVYEGVAPRGVLEDEGLGRAVLEALGGLGVRGVYVKPFARDRSRLGGALPEVVTDASPAAGEAATEATLIREGECTLEVRMWDGLSTGLFLDQRANRAWVAERVRGLAGKVGGRRVEVLNAFAYTCAFSVAAAVAGAMTSSVDVSGKYLEWGKRNFGHNGIGEVGVEGGHRFARMDTFEFLGYAKRKGLSYDLAILDPPSFGSGSKAKGIRPWSATADYARLVRETAGVVRRGGVVLASTNTRELCEPGRLEREIVRGLGREPAWVRLPGVAEDFAGERGRFAARAFGV
jgi:23S rRNA (cytosine1962-C5)-methyltransferase